MMKKSEAIAALGAMAQETRLEIFRLLVQRGPAGMPAGEIGAKLSLPSPTLSFHLNQLRHAGLISSHRDSRSIIYAADYGRMNRLLSYLTENCCQGDPAACAPMACAPAQAERRSNVILRPANMRQAKGKVAV
jgi:ArsR family transcriptional regulator, arsenate/arsenite/antimonite-responsive transcriptional repressor